MTTAPSITINGKDYVLADLSDSSRAQIGNVQVVDGEIARLQQQLAIAQTARNAYVAALIATLNESAADEGAAKADKARSKK